MTTESVAAAERTLLYLSSSPMAGSGDPALDSASSHLLSALRPYCSNVILAVASESSGTGLETSKGNLSILHFEGSRGLLGALEALDASIGALSSRYREDKSILVDIRKAVDSSMQLRSKKELIEHFIETVNAATDVNDDWHKFVLEQKETDLETLITGEKLKPEETRKFIDNSFRDGILKTTGTDIDKILPPVSRFGGGNRNVKKQSIIEKLKTFFEKYFGLV